ncbi:hypothetical protein ON010_g13438 [Phytophthora cinnamomi]|nr:hypothetical protein ON010_g13438 [Phytophthora cinnamomi]
MCQHIATTPIRRTQARRRRQDHSDEGGGHDDDTPERVARSYIATARIVVDEALVDTAVAPSVLRGSGVLFDEGRVCGVDVAVVAVHAAVGLLAAPSRRPIGEDGYSANSTERDEDARITAKTAAKATTELLPMKSLDASTVSMDLKSV